MEKSLASVSFSEFENEEEADRAEESDTGSESSQETRKMVLKQNRKGKKSGGFQSMGKIDCVRPADSCC